MARRAPSCPPLSSLVANLRNGEAQDRSKALVDLLCALDEAEDITVAEYIVASGTLQIINTILGSGSESDSHLSLSVAPACRNWSSQDRATSAFVLQAVIEFTPLTASAVEAGALASLVTYLRFCDDASVGGDALWGRQPAVEALGTLAGAERWRSSVVFSGAVVPLVALLSDPDHDLKTHAAWALGNLAAKEVPAAAPSLEELLASGGVADCGSSVRLAPEASAQLAILIAPGAAVSALVGILRQEYDKGRMGEGGSASLPLLTPTKELPITSPGVPCANAAARLLGRLVLDNIAATGEMNQATPVLLKMFREGDAAGRSFAEQALNAHAAADPSGRGAVSRMVAERPREL